MTLSSRPATSIVEIRDADNDDARYVFSVNNHPTVREQSVRTEDIPWESHARWFERQLVRTDGRLFVGVEGALKVGVARFDIVRDEAVISIAVGFEHRGRGVGARLVEQVTDRAFARPEVRRTVAFTRPGNVASQRAFLGNGYRQIGETTEGGATLVKFEKGSGLASVRLSLVIPVYNEAPTLRAAVQRIVAVDVDKELVIVDDGSTDGSRELLEELDAKGLTAWLPNPELQRGHNETRVHLQPRNMGKGAALRAGIGLSTGDIVVFQDADLEYDPRDIPGLIKPIVDGIADVTFGSRFIGSPRRVLYFWHTVMNQGLTLASNMLNDLNITDMETCYKAFRADVIKAIDIEEDRFGVEPELTAKVAKQRLRIYEVPISYQGRTYEEGKKIGIKDAARAVYCILKYGIRRRS